MPVSLTDSREEYVRTMVTSRLHNDAFAENRDMSRFRIEVDASHEAKLICLHNVIDSA